MIKINNNFLSSNEEIFLVGIMFSVEISVLKCLCINSLDDFRGSN